MAQFFTVTDAFQGTVSKEDKTPVKDKYGNTRWMFKVKDQGPDGWMSLQRKEGATLEPGDEVYGIIDTWPDTGKAKFVRQNPPEGSRQANVAPRSAQHGTSEKSASTSIDDLERRVSTLESILVTTHGASFGQKDVILDDIEDGPVDLSDIEY